jgi:hypothetical protein
MTRALIGSLVLWCALCAGARAQTRVVVFDFDGGRESTQLRDAVVDMLEDKAVEVVSTKVANAQARKSGAELDTESGRVRVGKKLRLTAFVEGSVQRAKRSMKVQITVYGARDGLIAGEMTLSAPKKQLISEVRATFWEQLGPAIKGQTAPVNEPEPEPMVEAPPVRQQQQPQQQRPVRAAPQEEGELAQAEPEPAEVPEEADDSQPSAAANALDINIGARFGTRSFAYSDPFPGLRKYGMSLSPNLRLAVRWYPVAHFNDSALSNIGLDLRGELLVGVTSKNRSGQKFETSAHSLGVGVRGRLPFRTFEFGAVVGYGVHAFSLDSTSKADPDVPDASYGFLRAGLDARWTFYDPLYASVQAAYLFGLSHGEIEDRVWFPHTSGDGVEAELALGGLISRSIGVEAAFGLQRYFMSFDPEPRDPGVRGPGRVAGGAIDQYISARVAMVIRL